MPATLPIETQLARAKTTATKSERQRILALIKTHLEGALEVADRDARRLLKGAVTELKRAVKAVETRL